MLFLPCRIRAFFQAVTARHSGLLARALACFLVMAACFSSAAQAQSCSATVPAGNYGNVDILSGGTNDTTGSFVISCTGTANRVIRLCVDMSYGDTVNQAGAVRALTDGTNYLLHDIYSDAARSVQWGAWGGNTLLFPFGSGGVQRDIILSAAGSVSSSFTMYGRVAASQQTLPPGSYSWGTASPGFTYYYTATSNAACPSGTLSFRGGVRSDIWTATILANCLVTATVVDFGSNGFLVSNIDSTGTITARCTSSTPYIIALNNGSGGGTGPTARKMINGAQSVIYGLYRDAARSLPFGSTSGTDTAAGTGTGLAQNITVYGRVPPQTTPVPGAYADTIVVTVTY